MNNKKRKEKCWAGTTHIRYRTEEYKAERVNVPSLSEVSFAYRFIPPVLSVAVLSADVLC